jgi:hypothetical protein
VRKTPLPKCRDPELEKIQFGSNEVVEKAPEFFDPEIEALHEKELISEPIKVASSLRGAHPLVARTRDGGDDEWRLAVSVSDHLLRRALLVMDAVLKGLEKRGYTVKKPESQWSRETKVVGHGHEFGLRLREPTNRKVKDLTPQQIEYRKQYPSPHHRTRYEFIRRGILQLEITGFPGWHPKVLRDGKTPLEDRLADLPCQMLKAIDAERREAAKRAEEERQRQEAKRLWAQEQDRLKRKQERLARRRKRDEALFQLADQWQRCETLRGFIAAVRRVAVEEVGFAEVDPKIAKWLVWAERVAGRHDPLERLRRSAPGRRRPR